MTDVDKSNYIASANSRPPSNLPDWCYTILPSSGALIIVEQDVRGYGMVSDSTDNRERNRDLATKYNAEIGITLQQEAAMLGGFMFGWDTPAARVSSYNMQGAPIPPTKQKPVSVAKTETASSQSAIESDFLHTPSDAFAIYQLKSSDSTRDLRFEPLVLLQLTGKTVDRANYQCVYTAPLPANAPKTPMEQIHVLYEQFNIARPADFAEHSLSVSDVVALKQDGQIACHYVDRWSFAELSSFLSTDNPIKNAEKAIENDCGMDNAIYNKKRPFATELLKPTPDSREPVSKAPKKNVRRDNEQKPSILEQLKPKPREQAEQTKKPPVKKAEQER